MTPFRDTRRLVALATTITLLCGIASPLASQSTVTPTPLPYTIEEFTEWQRELRRASIISFLASVRHVLTSMGYDVYRYYDHGEDERYKPWPFKDSSIAIPKSEDEQKRIVLIAAGISLAWPSSTLRIGPLSARYGAQELTDKTKTMNVP
jgi:amino acid transporter